MNNQIFQKRRQDLQARLEDDALAIFFSAPPQLKSNDVYHPYRQNSDFYYLTGMNEEESVLVLDSDRVTLFLRPHDPEQERWFGNRLGLDAASELSGIDRAVDIGQLQQELPQLLKNKSMLYYCYGRQLEQDRIVLPLVDQIIRQSRKGDYGPQTIRHPALLLHDMRMLKSPEEVELLVEIASITDRAHRRLWAQARPGLYEFELEAHLQYEFRRGNGREAYPSIVASGANACILHYTENNRLIQEGDLVLVDAGAEKEYLNIDVTRTFPVSGKFSVAQRTLYGLVLAVQKSAIERSVAGSSMEMVHKETVRQLVQGLCGLEILREDPEKIIADESYRDYYMHGTGHWLGIDVHDVGDYYRHHKPRPLENGMLCTVEPGLYFAPDYEGVQPEFRGIGIRIEDDVLIDGQTPRNLTAEIPKEIHDLEQLIGRDA